MKIFTNGLVYTQDGMKEAFVVDRDRFVYVGSNEEAAKYEGEVTDLQGQFVCAGFNDSHMHLLHFGECQVVADLSTQTGSMEQVQDGLKQFAAEHELKPGQWMVAMGVNQDYFRGEKRFPDRHDLDLVSEEIPIMLNRTCGHICAVNSKALELMGLETVNPDGSRTVSEIPEVDGGEIQVDANGVPTGWFFENAIECVNACLPTYTIEDVKHMLVEAAHWVNRQGITSVQTDDFITLPSVNWRTVIQAYRELIRDGLLTVRVNEQSQLQEPEQLQEFLDEGYTTGVGDTMFKIGPLKIIGDGSLGARTAYMRETYADQPEEKGMLVASSEKLKKLVMLAHTHNMQVAVHAIGDGCVDGVLDAYEEAIQAFPRSDHRHGIVHCQLMRPEHYERFKELGVHGYIQSIFLDYDIRIVRERAGETLAASSYGGSCYPEMGISMSNGSDAPVELPVPLRGIQCAVTRQDLAGTFAPYRPDQAMTVKQALDSFTTGGAYASFEEDIKGDIRTGMLADFIVLAQNPFCVPTHELAKIPVQETWLGGERIFSLAEKNK